MYVNIIGCRLFKKRERDWERTKIENFKKQKHNKKRNILFILISDNSSQPKQKRKHVKQFMTELEREKYTSTYNCTYYIYGYVEWTLFEYKNMQIPFWESDILWTFVCFNPTSSHWYIHIYVYICIYNI